MNKSRIPIRYWLKYPAAGLCALLLLIGVNPRMGVIEIARPNHSHRPDAEDPRNRNPRNEPARVNVNQVAQRSTNGADELVGEIRKTLNQLRLPGNRSRSLVSLASLKRRLTAHKSAEQSVRAILQFLSGGEDAETGLAFRVGPGHELSEAPTLRTALLDWLGRIEPLAAAESAQLIFEAFSSPEEYAVSLRNFAVGRPKDRGQLRDYFEKLLNNRSWNQVPSPGFVEAFDVVPYLRDPSFADELGPLLDSALPIELRHASLVALDRLMLANPAGSMERFLQNGILAEQPLLRASCVARADVRDPAQCRLAERYLLLPSVSDAELDKFFHLFPNANYFASYNLLTAPAPRSIGEVAQIDKASLEKVGGWLHETRFRPLRARLSGLQKRLRGHVVSAKRGNIVKEF